MCEKGEVLDLQAHERDLVLSSHVNVVDDTLSLALGSLRVVQLIIKRTVTFYLLL